MKIGDKVRILKGTDHSFGGWTGTIIEPYTGELEWDWVIDVDKDKRDHVPFWLADDPNLTIVAKERQMELYDWSKEYE